MVALVVLLAIVGVGAVMLARSISRSNTADYIIEHGGEDGFADCVVDAIKDEIGGFADFDDGVDKDRQNSAVDGFVFIFHRRCRSHTALTRSQILERFPGGL